MGVQIADIVPRDEITLKDLKGRVVAVDAFNTIYQFLTTIRQPDGTPLMDKKGRITSHISGLFYRNINLMVDGIKPIFVFDGKPAELKREELERRKELKIAAQEKYEMAKASGNIEEMRRYSQQFVKIDDTIIAESKELLEALGIPVVQALGEGEAEAAMLVRSGDAWASASQDYDSLLYGTPRLIRNLTLARKRKTSAGTYVEVKPEMIDFDKLLNHLHINKDQLICLGILVGTDFNPGGVRGIGQKRALETVQKQQYPVKIFEYIQNSGKYAMDFNWQDIYAEFHEPPRAKPEISFQKPDYEKITKILLSRDFSQERIDSALEKLKGAMEERKQKTLF